MKVNEAIRAIMKDRRVTQVHLANLLGVTQPKVANNLTRENMRIDTLVELLEAMDCELTVQPKRQGRRPEGQYVINLEKED